MQDRVFFTSTSGPPAPLFTTTTTPRAASSPSFPSPPSLAIWIESLRSTLLFSSAQLLEMWAPLWRSSTHRGCCLGSSPREARTATGLFTNPPGLPDLCLLSPETLNCFRFTHSSTPGPSYLRSRRAFHASLDGSSALYVALPPAPTDAPVRPRRRATFLWTTGPQFIPKVKASCFCCFSLGIFWILRLSLKST